MSSMPLERGSKRTNTTAPTSATTAACTPGLKGLTTSRNSNTESVSTCSCTGTRTVATTANSLSVVSASYLPTKYPILQLAASIASFSECGTCTSLKWKSFSAHQSGDTITSQCPTSNSATSARLATFSSSEWTSKPNLQWIPPSSSAVPASCYGIPCNAYEWLLPIIRFIAAFDASFDKWRPPSTSS